MLDTKMFLFNLICDLVHRLFALIILLRKKRTEDDELKHFHLSTKFYQRVFGTEKALNKANAGACGTKNRERKNKTIVNN